MNFSDLTKEQKQYVIFGAAGVAIIALAIFGVKLSMSSIKTARLELDDLTAKVETAKNALSSREKMKADFCQSALELKKHLQNAPPEKNYYSWASEIIYAKGRDVDLEIVAVDEMSSKAALTGDNTAQFESYALRITAHGGFNQVKEFLNSLEAKFPLIRFTGMEISSGAAPEVHDIQVFVQWPFRLGEVKAICMKAESMCPAVAEAGSEKETSVVAADPEPEVESAPVEAKPEPVVATVPVAEPEPEVKPAPVETKPEPVVAAVPVAEPVTKPEPKLVQPEPEVEQPEPVVANMPVDEPEIQPDPIVEEPEPEVVPEAPQVEVAVVSEPEPEPEVESLLPEIDEGDDEDVETADAGEESESLDAFLQQLGQDSVSPEEIPEAEPVPVVAEPTPEPFEDGPVRYVSTGKSAKKLEELLTKNAPKKSESLDSFLDGLVEEIQ